MDPRFTEYGANVCTFVRHATAKEKEAIRKELADHMEDHAQALMDGGFPEDHANRVALESMGDPETVGRELDKEYPLRWLVLSRILIGVVALLALSYLIFLAICRKPSGPAWTPKRETTTKNSTRVSNPWTFAGNCRERPSCGFTG